MKLYQYDMLIMRSKLLPFPPHALSRNVTGEKQISALLTAAPGKGSRTVVRLLARFWNAHIFLLISGMGNSS